MKKVVLFLSLLGMCNLSFGQKKVEIVNGDELNSLAKMIYYKDLNFSKKDVEKYRIGDVLGYWIEYVNEEKVIYRDVVKKNVFLGGGISQYIVFDTRPCFVLRDISDEVAFSLLKTNEWEVKQALKGESLCVKINVGGSPDVKEFIYKDGDEFKFRDLADGKIKTKLYRLEEE